MQELYQDEFYRGFNGNSEYDALKEAQTELEDAMIWEKNASGFSVIPIATPMDAELRATDPVNSIPKAVLLDTAENSEIILCNEVRVLFAEVHS